MTGHPNATATLIAGAIATIVVWIAGLFGLDVPQIVEGAFVTLIAAGALFVKGPKPASTARRESLQ